MAATFHWCSDHGAATGSPSHGTTRNGFGADTAYPTNGDWKNVDDDATAHGSSTVAHGSNSYDRFHYGHFTGTFNTISNAKWTANNSVGGVNKTGVSLMGGVLSTYRTPATTSNTNLTTNFTTQVFVKDGLPVNFSTTGPEDASPTATLTAPGYTQYFGTQILTSGAATAGAMTPALEVFVWDED